MEYFLGTVAFFISLFFAIILDNMMWILAMIPLMFVFLLLNDKFETEIYKEKESEILKDLKTKGFIVTKRKFSLLIDQNNKKWCVLDKVSSTPYIHDFSDIIDFTILENGIEYRSDGVATRAITGGAIFGSVGALIGASTANKRTSINNISIMVITSDFNKPSERIHISGAVASTTSAYYQECVNASYEIIGLLTAAKTTSEL